MILEKICKQVSSRLNARKKQVSEASILKDLKSARKPHSFVKGLSQDGIHIIAEVKRASPSQGAINLMSDPNSIATSYLCHGAFGISVLTETDFFNGNPAFLKSIRDLHPEARLLMKDFVLDPFQLAEARILGADAVLLIAKALSKSQLKELVECALEFSLSPLVEVHNEDELQLALETNTSFVGINNRCLDTFKTDLSATKRLMKMIPPGITVISESGIHNGQDIKDLLPTGVRGFLVGSTLMRQEDPGLGLALLLKEANQCI